MRASSSSGAGGAPAAREEEVAPFEDGQYVRLVSRGRGGGYLFADDTGRGVSVDRRRGAAATAWAVQILRTPRAAHVLLRGAYGRYLAVTNNAPRPGHAGYYVAQCVFDDPDDHHIEWWTAPGTRGSVLLLHGTAGGLRALRANGRYKRWHTGVTVEAVNFSRVTSMMEWEVQVIPMRVERPPYQPRPATAAIRWHEGCQKEVEISFVRADDNGNFERQGWREMLFDGRSLTELGNEIATRMGCGVKFEDLTLFVLGGRLARPTPLLTDLPFRGDPVMILVFVDGTPGQPHSHLTNADSSPGSIAAYREPRVTAGGRAAQLVRVTTGQSRDTTVQHSRSPEPSRSNHPRPVSPKPRPCSQIEISLPHPVPVPSPHRTPASRGPRSDGLGVVLPALRRQPLGGRHLRGDGRALRGHLLAPHLPHRHLQLPPRLHRAPLPQARRHEVRRRLLLLLLLLRRAARGGLLAGQEDGPRRDQPQGRRAGALARQAQVRRRSRRRTLRRLRPAQLALRGSRRRQAALRARPARPADEPPRPARERPHRLLHGLPLLPLLHEHPHQPPEAARIRAPARRVRGGRGALPHARSQSELSCDYQNHRLISRRNELNEGTALLLQEEVL